jgi:hypothetical protein
VPAPEVREYEGGLECTHKAGARGDDHGEAEGPAVEAGEGVVMLSPGDETWVRLWVRLECQGIPLLFHSWLAEGSVPPHCHRGLAGDRPVYQRVVVGRPASARCTRAFTVGRSGSEVAQRWGIRIWLQMSRVSRFGVDTFGACRRLKPSPPHKLNSLHQVSHLQSNPGHPP